MKKDLNAMYREEGWGRITDAALGIEPEHVESQAREVARWAADALEKAEALYDALNEIEGWRMQSLDMMPPEIRGSWMRAHDALKAYREANHEK